MINAYLHSPSARKIVEEDKPKGVETPSGPEGETGSAVEVLKISKKKESEGGVEYKERITPAKQDSDVSMDSDDQKMIVQHGLKDSDSKPARTVNEWKAKKRRKEKKRKY